MLYKFLISKDLNLIIKPELLESNFETTEELHDQIRQSERSALSIVRSNIARRIDMATALPSMSVWENGKEYQADELVYYAENLFVAKQTNTSSKPSKNPNDWRKDDPRDATLVMHTAAIAVYYALKQNRSRNIPQNVKESYKDAKDWLKDMKEWIESSELPQNSTEEAPPIISQDGMDTFRDLW